MRQNAENSSPGYPASPDSRGRVSKESEVRSKPFLRICFRLRCNLLVFCTLVSNLVLDYWLLWLQRGLTSLKLMLEFNPRCEELRGLTMVFGGLWMWSELDEVTKVEPPWLKPGRFIRKSETRTHTHVYTHTYTCSPPLLPREASVLPQMLPARSLSPHVCPRPR